MLPYRRLLDPPSEYFPRGNHTYAHVHTKYKYTFIILAAKGFMSTCELSKIKQHGTITGTASHYLLTITQKELTTQQS